MTYTNCDTNKKGLVLLCKFNQQFYFILGTISCYFLHAEKFLSPNKAKERFSSDLLLQKFL